MTRVITLSTILALAACAHEQPLIISGDAMVILADQFVNTASAMDKALESKVITPEQYTAWTVFGKRFQEVYPLTVSLWRVAQSTNDVILEGQMVAKVNSLAVELATFSGGAK